MNFLLKNTVVLTGCFYATLLAAMEWRGSLSVEDRLFPETALDPRQHDNYTSFTIHPELYQRWDNGTQSLTIAPFYRWDQYDKQRSHADLREGYWQYVGDGYAFSAGVRKVFWGTTESPHLVDVINQTDLVEKPDGTDKLGQPMLAATLQTDQGNMEIYLMPYFRERTFPGEQGRLRTLPRVDTDSTALYESDQRDKHIDWALRWSKTFGSWDIGLSHFYGTNREPRLIPAVNYSGEPILLPYYELMHQTGLDIQSAIGAWLFKLEAIVRATQQTDFTALTTGFEYTFYQVNASGLDMGIVAEYLYDSRGDTATTPFNHDLLLGVRLNPNDVAGTEVLLSVLWDHHSDARVYRLKGSRRLSDHFKINMEAVGLSRFPTRDPYYSIHHDDYIQAGLSYYF